jgi:hypothetical protein
VTRSGKANWGSDFELSTYIKAGYVTCGTIQSDLRMVFTDIFKDSSYTR